MSIAQPKLQLLPDDVSYAKFLIDPRRIARNLKCLGVSAAAREEHLDHETIRLNEQILSCLKGLHFHSHLGLCSHELYLQQQNHNHIINPFQITLSFRPFSNYCLYCCYVFPAELEQNKFISQKNCRRISMGCSFEGRVICFKQWNLLIIRVMLKPLMVLMVSAASCLMGLFLYRLIPYKLHTLGLIQFNSHNLTGIPHAHLQHKKQNELIDQLSRLTSVPLLGQFYKKEMINELIELRHWEEALSETNRAVETFLHRHSFSIWFYKALSQCMLERISDCEKSTHHAEYLLDPQYKRSMAELYRFLQSKMKNEQSPQIEKVKRETARLNMQEL